MVFNCIFMIKGILLDTNKLYQFLEFLNNEQFSIEEFKKYENADDEYIFWDLIDEINKYIKRFGRIQIYRMKRCCSDIKTHTYVLGKISKTYYRINAICDNCPKYACCKRCLGLTDNGYYDIYEIFNNVTRVPDNQVCKICYHDKKENNECKFCNFEMYQYQGVREREPRFEKSIFDSRVDKFFNVDDIKYYLLLDDCTSCT